MATSFAPPSIYRSKEGMGVWPHRGKVAAVGIGHSPTDRRWDGRVETSVGAYALLAAKNALADAGITKDSLDGMVVVPDGTGDPWGKPIPVDFGKAFLPTENPEDGLSQMSADWMIKNMGLKNIKAAYHAPTCVSNALVVAAEMVGSGMCNTLLVVRVLNNMPGRYMHSGANLASSARGPRQWSDTWGFNAAGTGFAYQYAQYLKKYNQSHDKLAPFVVNLRRNGRMFPEGYYYQHPEAPLTVDDYLNARWISKPLSLMDCDRPIQVSICYVITTAERAKDMKQPPVYILNHATTRVKSRSSVFDLDETEAATDSQARKLYEGSGLTSKDIDLENCYEGFTIFHHYFLEALQWHGVKRGESHDFYAGDIRVEGPHPIQSSGGNNGSGRTRAWMHTDCIQQLQRRAGPRAIKIRCETGVSGGPMAAGSDMLIWSRSPNPG